MEPDARATRELRNPAVDAESLGPFGEHPLLVAFLDRRAALLAHIARAALDHVAMRVALEDEPIFAGLVPVVVLVAPAQDLALFTMRARHPELFPRRLAEHFPD